MPGVRFEPVTPQLHILVCSKRKETHGDCPHFSHMLVYFRVSVSWVNYFIVTVATKFSGP